MTGLFLKKLSIRIFTISLCLLFMQINVAHAQDTLITVDEVPEFETPSGEGLSSSAAPQIEEDEAFFDSDNSIAPQGELANEGPLSVDPRQQVASRFVVVEKSHEKGSHNAKIVAAERALSLGRLDSALLMYDGLFEKNKKDPRVLMGRALTLQKLNRFEDAMQMYETLSEVQPDNVEVKVNMLGLLGTRFPAVALKRLKDLHNSHTNHIGVLAQIAFVAAQSGDVDTAIQYLGVASSIQPKNASHVYNMAIITDRAGHSDKAIKFYEQALEIDTIYGGGRSIPRDSVYERLAKLR
ncbi:MAG: tetratricopeptide repeat protein [Alphaproteobacteria bacterium]|nr:tetratricopeptide repeat protein [Alphaproteobacteria bacterium]